MMAPQPMNQPSRFAQYKRRARQALWRNQRGLCFYCRQPCALFTSDLPKGRPHPENAATLDHIIPLAKGGTFNPYRNCVVACRACNRERGTTDARIFALTKQGFTQ